MIDEINSVSEDVVVDELDKFPIAIRKCDYEKLLGKIENKEEFSAEEYELVKDIIHNARFWKKRYIAVQTKILNLFDFVKVFIQIQD